MVVQFFGAQAFGEIQPHFVEQVDFFRGEPGHVGAEEKICSAPLGLKISRVKRGRGSCMFSQAIPISLA